MIRCYFIEQKLLDQRLATLWEKISALMGREGVDPLGSDFTRHEVMEKSS